jgi:hypothetical protein
VLGLGEKPATGSLMSFVFIGPGAVMQKLVIPRPRVWDFLKRVEKCNYQAS